MPLTCNYPNCDGATKLVGDNSDNPGREKVVEEYECEFGHRFYEEVSIHA